MPRSGSQIPYGVRDGRLVHISEVDSGVACGCICPECAGQLVARKGPKTAHHFAHYPGADCNPETVLHRLGKQLLFDRLEAALAAESSVPIAWACTSCCDTHLGSLTKKAVKAELECDLGRCRPDIALLGASGEPVALLEIVVTHRPDELVQEYARLHTVPIVEFHLESGDDLEELAGAEPLTPTVLDLCTRRKCDRCGGSLSVLTLHVVNASCWKCHRPMSLAMLDAEGFALGASRMDESQAQLARTKGVRLEQRFSRAAGERYLANVCPHCGAMTGEFHLHNYWYDMVPQNGVAVGTVCVDCEMNGDLEPPER